MTALIPVRASQLPAKLRAKVGASMGVWFERLGPHSRALYRRGLVHFAIWLANADAIELDEEPEPREAGRAEWEDHACSRAGQYLLGFPHHDALHLVEAYLADMLFSKRFARATVASRLASLRWAVRQAQRANLVQWDLQAAKVPSPRKDRHGKLVERAGRDMRGPEPEEKVRLLAVAQDFFFDDGRILVVMSMGLNEGYREHEIRAIDLSDIDLKNSSVMMVRKKRGKPETYPLSKMTIKAIRRWLVERGDEDGPLLYGGRYGSLRAQRVGSKTLFCWTHRCCAEAKIKAYSPHRLRHRACTDIVDYAIRMHLPEERILFLTGHSSRAALQPYYDMTSDRTSERAVLDAASSAKPRAKKSKPLTSTTRGEEGDR